MSRFNLELRDLVKLQFQNGHRLRFVQPWKRFEQFVAGIAFARTAANDFQGAIEIIKNDRESFEQMDSFFELPQIEFETFGDRLQTELQKLFQDVRQAQSRRDHRPMFVGKQAGGVVAEVLFERRVLEQIRHHRLGVGARLQFEHDSQGVLVVRFVV